MKRQYIINKKNFNNIKKIHKLTSKYICANFCYRRNKETIFAPYKVIDTENEKI